MTLFFTDEMISSSTPRYKGGEWFADLSFLLLLTQQE